MKEFVDSEYKVAVDPNYTVAGVKVGETRVYERDKVVYKTAIEVDGRAMAYRYLAYKMLEAAIVLDAADKFVPILISYDELEEQFAKMMYENAGE